MRRNARDEFGRRQAGSRGEHRCPSPLMLSPVCVKRTVGLLVIAIGLSMLTAPAQAAGAEAAFISGPGLERPIEINWRDHARLPSEALDLPIQTGAWFLTSADEVRPLSASPPTKDLGPQYTLTWIMAGPTGLTREERSIRQDIYPDADGGPLVHTRPGQNIWAGAVGWFSAPDRLRATLTALGVPVDSTSPSEQSLQAKSVIIALSLVIGACVAVWAGSRRRRSLTKPDPRHA